MNLMLLVIFGCVGVGLLAPRFGRAQYLSLIGIAVGATLLYIIAPVRFM